METKKETKPSANKIANLPKGFESQPVTKVTIPKRLGGRDIPSITIAVNGSVMRLKGGETFELPETIAELVNTEIENY